MKIVDRLTTTGADDAAIRQWEESIGSRLPADYRAFLQACNGGRPDPSCVLFQTAQGMSDAVVRYFLALDSQQPYYSLQKYRKTYAGRIPRHALAIACDSFGNLFLLSCDERTFGAVYFWDHELETDDDDEQETAPLNITFLADSFSDFLRILR